MSCPFFVVNPVAGGGRAARAAERIRARHAGAEVAITAAPRDAERLARQAAEQGFDPVVAVGGDGTVQEVASGLLRAGRRDPPALGVVPAGTGNDFARGMRLPRDVQRPVDTAFEPGSAARIDVGQCGERFFLNAAGAGLDADVAAAVNAGDQTWRRARLSYVLFTRRELWRHPTRVLRVWLDGQPLPDERRLLVAVANGPYYGGGMRICPGADPTDGLLDVCVIGNVSRLEVLRLLPRVYSGGHASHPAVRFYRARSVRIESADGARAHLDGEPLGALPRVFTVLPGALRLAGLRTEN